MSRRLGSREIQRHVLRPAFQSSHLLLYALLAGSTSPTQTVPWSTTMFCTELTLAQAAR